MWEIDLPANEINSVYHTQKLPVVKCAQGGLNVSFTLRETPVFFVTRHERYKKCFSRNTAINHLAHFMTHKVFECSGFVEREPDYRVFINGTEMWERGAVTEKYIAAQRRCQRRIRKIIRRQREIERWHQKHESIKRQYAELLSKKPF